MAGLIEEALAPTLKRPVEKLSYHLPVHSAEHASGVLGAYEEAGVKEVLLLLLADEIRQIEMFSEQAAVLMQPSSN